YPFAVITAASQAGNPIALGAPTATTAGGSVTLTSTSCSYTAPANGVGEGGVVDTISYTIGNTAGSSSATITFTVADEGDDPVDPDDPVIVASVVIGGVTFRTIAQDVTNCANPGGCYQVIAEGEHVFAYPALGKLHTSIVNYEGGASAA